MAACNNEVRLATGQSKLPPPPPLPITSTVIETRPGLVRPRTAVGRVCVRRRTHIYWLQSARPTLRWMSLTLALACPVWFSTAVVTADLLHLEACQS
ncbi:hypothetical protein BJY04DRAFT_197219 [Aspergillus karnatakaensis]|uniref:uncharacterized protein n=1 Tax=Aspergillus karnatakaensis TaxID=1810916 RepID=UPI003CCDC28D